MLIDRIVVVGLGSIGHRHLRFARELFPDADIRVLRHQSSGLTPKYANGIFFRLEEALHFAPQIAVIASPAVFHIEIAQSFATNGTHLFIEKPLSATSSGVPILLETCDMQGLVLMVGYNLRFFSSLDYFRSQVRQNRIGRVLSVRAEVGKYLPSWRPEFDYRQGVSARQELGGGALLELSHEIDYLRWIFGEVDWVKATLGRQSDLEINVEDTAHLILGFMPNENGRRLIATLNMDFIRHDDVRMCVAIGESGSLRWNGLTGAVELLEAGAKEWRMIFCKSQQRDESYLIQWQHFLACIRKQSSPLVSGEDGLRVVQIIEAAREAAKLCSQIQVLRQAAISKNI